MTSPSHFAQLLQAATLQPQPQQLLFVFAAAQLPDDATPEQRARFEAGEGGALEPLACVDRTPGELGSFEALVEEARGACPAWQVVFISTLSGQDGQPPSHGRVDAALGKMVDGLRAGVLAPYMALDPMGAPVLFS
ncbi:MAG: ribonucleotide reductase subunit alpha [Comamonadaceae bacterium]|nr:MAG: ribonucleotide reductase subunit alpha [Comamonadaceae bacterium]